MTSDLMEKRIQSSPEDDVRRYLSEIRQYPLLTPEEEREIAMGCARGDEDAIRKMVNSNLRLVVFVAKDYAGRGVPLMDLIQEGSIGLLAAAKRFDYTLEFRFSTYATKWIRQGVTKCLMEHNLIRVPAHMAERIRKVMAARESLLQEEREPTMQNIADRCGLSAQKVERCMQLHPEICSLDAPVREDSTMGEFLEDVHAQQPYEKLIREELNYIMENLLSNLDERQQRVLRLRFGMEDGHCYSLVQIGDMLGISKERTRQIERQSIGILQKCGANMGLEDFLN